MNPFLTIIKKLKLLIIFIYFKRIFIWLNNVLSFIYYSTIWLFTSKEHTNFSVELNKNNLMSIKLFLENNFSIDDQELNKYIEFTQTVNLSRKKYPNTFSSPYFDVDFKNKWDYRLVSFILFFSTEVHDIFEFGYDQGRLPLLINEYLNHKDLNSEYIGIDINPRKGALVKNVNLNKNISLFNISTENFLQNKNISDKLNDSILISSTHNKLSEYQLFCYLDQNELLPKIIISDEVSDSSDYIKFLKNKNYKNNILIFNDKNHFIKPNYIGISVKQD